MPDDIQLVEPGSIPLTTSGKIQRFMCRLEYERGNLHLERKPWRDPQRKRSGVAHQARQSHGRNWR